MSKPSRFLHKTHCKLTSDILSVSSFVQVPQPSAWSTNLNKSWNNYHSSLCIWGYIRQSWKVYKKQTLNVQILQELLIWKICEMFLGIQDTPVYDSVTNIEQNLLKIISIQLLYAQMSRQQRLHSNSEPSQIFLLSSQKTKFCPKKWEPEITP